MTVCVYYGYWSLTGSHTHAHKQFFVDRQVAYDSVKHTSYCTIGDLAGNYNMICHHRCRLVIRSCGYPSSTSVAKVRVRACLCVFSISKCQPPRPAVSAVYHDARTPVVRTIIITYDTSTSTFRGQSPRATDDRWRCKADRNWLTLQLRGVAYNLLACTRWRRRRRQRRCRHRRATWLPSPNLRYVYDIIIMCTRMLNDVQSPAKCVYMTRRVSWSNFTRADITQYYNHYIVIHYRSTAARDRFRGF